MAVTIQGGKYTDIFALGTARVREIDAMFVTGKTASEIAHVIQNEWIALPNKSPIALIRQLNRYKKDHVSSHFVTGSTDEKGTTIIKFVKYSHQRDVMQELDELIELQRTRVQKSLDIEAKLPTTNWTTTQEMQFLQKMYRDYAQLQLETGVLKRVPQELHVRPHSEAIEASRNAHFASVQNQEKKMLVTSKILEIMGKPRREGDVYDAE